MRSSFRRVFETDEELEWVEKAKQGDPIAFEALYGKHKGKLMSLCVRMTGNASEAEEYVQEAFLQVYRKLNLFRGESAFSTWIYRLTVNVVLMGLRKKRVQTISMDEEPEPDAAPYRYEHPSADITLLGSVDRVTLERAIAQLPVGYRTVFILRDVEGYEHHEVAEILDCTVGNTKSQLHKARQRLRELLRKSRAAAGDTSGTIAA